MKVSSEKVKAVFPYLVLLLIMIGYTEIRFATYQPYDLRIERAYDVSVWLQIVYGDDHPANYQLEIPLVRQIPTLNDKNEIIRWGYSYTHLTLNISNSPAYRNAFLIIDCPRAVFSIFSSINCHWQADDKDGSLTETDFQMDGARFIAYDARIENAIWQTFFTLPLSVDITLTV